MKLSEFVEDPEGKSSSIRLVFLVWAIWVLVVWAVASLSARPVKLAPIDPTVLTLIGILMTGKAVQGFQESAASKKGDSIPTQPARGAASQSDPMIN